MAQDMIEVMEQLGHDRFFLAGCDRGGRTSHRMCLDHPERVLKVCLMDVLPNYFVWTNITKAWVIGTWHWAFMAQPEPFPERLISAVPAEFFLKSRMTIRGGNGLDFLTPAVFDEYVRCYTLKTITGSCRDYRATATCDFEMDTADKDRQIEMPAIVLWGARGQSPARSKEFLDVWKRFARKSRIWRSHGLRSLHGRGHSRRHLRQIHQILRHVASAPGIRRIAVTP